MTDGAGDALAGPARQWLRRAVKGAGIVLLVVSLGYVAREMGRNWDEIARWRPSARDLGMLVGLAVLYAAMLYLLAEAWHRIVGLFGPEGRRRTWRSYALTQIARYLPGNVAHLLGRALVLRGGPLSDRQLGMATAMELVLVPAGAVIALGLCVVFVPTGALLWDAFGLEPPSVPILGLVGVVLVGGLAVAVAVARRRWPGRLAAISVVLGLCTVFMLAFGGIFGAVVMMLGDGGFWVAAMAGILAWLVGYATPGAPGGIGPREAMLVLVLSDTLPAGELLIAATLLRLITITGDILCFAVGVAALRKAA